MNFTDVNNFIGIYSICSKLLIILTFLESYRLCYASRQYIYLDAYKNYESRKSKMTNNLGWEE
jgi:hypothetical protein